MLPPPIAEHRPFHEDGFRAILGQGFGIASRDSIRSRRWPLYRALVSALDAQPAFLMTDVRPIQGIALISLYRLMLFRMRSPASP